MRIMIRLIGLKLETIKRRNELSNHNERVAENSAQTSKR